VNTLLANRFLDHTTRVPPAFSGRRSSPITIARPHEVRRFRKFWSTGFVGLGATFGSLFWLFLWWPIAALSFLGGCFMLLKCLGIFIEAYSGNVKAAYCPTCERPINFWVSTAFPCPVCRHMLMQYENDLYDIA